MRRITQPGAAAAGFDGALETEARPGFQPGARLLLQTDLYTSHLDLLSVHVHDVAIGRISLLADQVPNRVVIARN